MTHNLTFHKDANSLLSQWCSDKLSIGCQNFCIHKYQISDGISFTASYCYAKKPLNTRMNYEYPVFILVYCEQGKSDFCLEGSNTKYTIKAGDIWLINLNHVTLVREFSPNVKTIMKVLKYNVQSIQDVLVDSITKNFSTSFILNLDRNHQCEEWFKSFSPNDTVDMTDKLMVVSRAISLLANTISPLSSDWDTIKDDKDKLLSEQIVRRISSFHEALPSLKDLEQEFHMSYTKLSFIFKKEKGQSIFAYYRKMRLQRALRLLQNKRIPITQISQICGFSSSSHFTESFKKEYMLTPSMYRRQLSLNG